MASPFTVAITGGIAEGKSTVISYLENAGYPVASADDIAASLIHENEWRDQIATVFELKPDWTTVEALIALSGNDEKRRRLNRLLHRPILDKLQASKAVFFEIPLLVETVMMPYFSAVWVVTCGQPIQHERLARRYTNQTQIEAILATQLPTRAKLPFADFVIRTNMPEGNVQTVTLAAAKKVVEMRLRTT